MEFGFTEEQEKLRKEVQDFFLNELPEDFEPHMHLVTKEQQSFWKELQEKAGERGYLTPGWDKENGGLGLSPIEQGIVQEAWGYWQNLNGMSWPGAQAIYLAGPAVHIFGNEEQKRKFLPPIAQGKAVWLQVFTEPDAGSDEANVQLRAVEDDNDFILNGQKTFIGGECKPDYLYTLARTANVKPKHRGISLLLVPADLPGITYRALPSMGGHMQNEIFFDDVRVSREYLLGELNRGFYHAMATFEFERGGANRFAPYQRMLEELVQFCKEEKRKGKPLIEYTEVRKVLAKRAVELEMMRLLNWYDVWCFSKKEELGPQPPTPAIQYYNKTLLTRWAKETMDMFGLFGQLRHGSKWAKYKGRLERQWQNARSYHGGGTVEIMKNVIAQRGLGMPRIPGKLREVIGQTLEKGF